MCFEHLWAWEVKEEQQKKNTGRRWCVIFFEKFSSRPLLGGSQTLFWEPLIPILYIFLCENRVGFWFFYKFSVGKNWLGSQYF